MRGMGRVLTLLYHRVYDLNFDKNQLAVTPENFIKQMAYLRENYKIVRFEQDWKELACDGVCITFDDGYMDNFTEALPILQELDIPATIFITSGHVDTSEEFWWDELERILLDKGREYNKTFALDDDFFSCQWPTETYSAREELYDTLHWLMYNKISVIKRKAWMRQLREWSNVGNTGRKENRAVSLEVLQKTPPLLTLGAHTVNHPSLKNLSENEQKYEIGQSIKDLECMLKHEISVFSYPFGGVGDFDKVAIELCKKENICKAAANFPGLWTSVCDDYQIPRNIVRNWDIDTYIKKIETFWQMR